MAFGDTGLGVLKSKFEQAARLVSLQAQKVLKIQTTALKRPVPQDRVALKQHSLGTAGCSSDGFRLFQLVVRGYALSLGI